MTSKYIPPHLRNRKDTTKKAEPVLMKDSDFPTMVTTNTKLNEFKGPSFREKMNEAPANGPIREVTEPMPAFTYKYTPRLKFRKEPEPQEEEEEEAPPPVTDDGWTTVEKKIRVKRDRVQEALDNGDVPIEYDNEEDSSWNDQQEEHETYWDERRR